MAGFWKHGGATMTFARDCFLSILPGLSYLLIAGYGLS